MRQMMVADGASRESPVRPVIRTFYDHMQVLLQHNLASDPDLGVWICFENLCQSMHRIFVLKFLL